MTCRTNAGLQEYHTKQHKNMDFALNSQYNKTSTPIPSHKSAYRNPEKEVYVAMVMPKPAIYKIS